VTWTLGEWRIPRNLGGHFMPVLDRDGVEIFYQVTGAATDRLPVLLTHGMAATAAMWDVNLPALSADRQVISWDIRGHGRSASPGDPAKYTEALSVADMTAILDAAGAGRAVIGGLSLGGYLSLAFHLAHPERTAALMLFDTGPGYRRDEPRQAWNDSADASARNMAERGLAALHSSAEVNASLHRGVEGLVLAQQGIMKQFDSRVIDSLTSIAVPTLVLVGADDKAFLNAADYMAAKVPGAVKVVLEGAGHAANIDQPQAFNRAVLQFLAAL
jgi:pimeloyl-ACP methyl ester carboxylesterase